MADTWSASGSEDEQSDDTGSAENEDAVTVLFRRRDGAAMHLEGLAMNVPLCYSNSGTILKDCQRVEGIRTLTDTPRAVCMKCLARISSRTASAISALRGE